MFKDSDFQNDAKGNPTYLVVGTKDGFSVAIKPLMANGGYGGPGHIGYMGTALYIGFRVRVNHPDKSAKESTASLPTLSDRYLKTSNHRCSFMALTSVDTTFDLPDKAVIEGMLQEKVPALVDDLLSSLAKDNVSVALRKSQLLPFLLSRIQPVFDEMFGAPETANEEGDTGGMEGIFAKIMADNTPDEEEGNNNNQ